MSEQDQSGASLSEKADAAFKEAMLQVIKQAEQAGTPVIVWDKDHVKKIPVDEIERQSSTF